jgi:hypothetical protein
MNLNVGRTSMWYKRNNKWGGYQLQQVRTIAFCSKDPIQNLTQMLDPLNYKGRELNPSSKLGKGEPELVCYF